MDEQVADLHWLLGILQHVDVGLVVLDRRFRVKLWNGFMENHSGIGPVAARDRTLFELFPQVDLAWLREQVEQVFLLDNRAFSSWRQRPFPFPFGSYRPFTGPSEGMYQNLTLFPLASANGQVEQVCLMLYDTTESAMDELALEQANAELDRLGRTDGLTGLLNRRAWEELLKQEHRREQRSGQASTLALFDIDHFKRINDTYGHPVGDEVIRRLAGLLKAVKRESDIAGRYGGEEFGVVLADTDLEGAIIFAERLRSSVEALRIPSAEGVITFTVSIGLALHDPAIRDHRAWIEAADQALYRAKREGRNRVVAL